jgi:flavin-dependent dehydrogenase
MEDLLPGLLEELVAAGAQVGDGLADATWYLDGRRLASAPSGITNYAVSRPLLEHLVRRRVVATPGVRLLTGTEVRGLLVPSGAVTGVEVGPARGAGAPGHVIDADLVVDAGGRSSRSLDWLHAQGHPRPPRSQVRSDVVYLTVHYRAEPGMLEGSNAVVVVPHPRMARGATALREEDGRIAVVLSGLVGEDPPSDEAGMVAYAESLGSPELMSVVGQGPPSDAPVKMRYPASVRWHPERSRRHPEGFLLLGDALGAFNPTYGQGMTTAALQAQLLRTLVAESTDRLPRRFYPRAGQIIDHAWGLATGGDMRFPQVEGRRPAGSALVERYLDRLRAAAAVDPALGRTFLQVSNMLRAPTALLSPRVVLRVVRARP